MEQLATQLETVKGKKSYGYLPKPVKKTVDEIVDKLEELPVVRECYDQWCALQNEVDSYYHDKPREKKKLSQEKEFRQIKNAVIQEAERIRLGDITFEDADLTGHDEPEQVKASLQEQKPEKPKGDMTFGAWLDRWYQRECKPQIRPKTQADYENRIYQHIIPELGSIPLAKLTAADLQQFYNRLKEGGRLLRVEQ